MELPNREQLVESDAKFRQLITTITSRQTRGGGRYNKHETARLRFIKTHALPGLRLGKLPDAQDERMLFLGPKEQLSGPDLTAMNAWADKWARDPRSKKPLGEKGQDLSMAEQTTLIQWARQSGLPFQESVRAQGAEECRRADDVSGGGVRRFVRRERGESAREHAREVNRRLERPREK